ncbi:MAG: hypothetical protein KF859_00380 [Phycisphaeraceae bacterium]|nr:hypothetical protein [Phycisphaeraceae bacterium]
MTPVELVGAPAQGEPAPGSNGGISFGEAAAMALAIVLLLLVVYRHFRQRPSRAQHPSEAAWKLILSRGRCDPEQARILRAYAAEKSISPAAAWVLANAVSEDHTTNGHSA